MYKIVAYKLNAYVNIVMKYANVACRNLRRLRSKNIPIINYEMVNENHREYNRKNQQKSEIAIYI